jgi:hypothetical protein
MRFIQTIFTALAFGSVLSVAAPVAKRSPQDLEAMTSAIEALGEATNGLTEKLNAFDGNIFGSLGVLFASLKVSGALDDATEAANNASPLSNKESQKFALNLQKITKPTLQSLKAAREKEPVFEQVFQAGLVGSQLKGTAGKQDALISAITAKVTPTFAKLIKQGAKPIQKAFQKTLAVYGQ